MGWLNDILNFLRRRKPPPGPPPGPPSSDLAGQLLTIHNRERGRLGLPLLILDARLCASAQRVAEACMASSRLDHYAGGTTPWQRIQAAGYNYTSASENLAQGQSTAEEVVADWLADPPHRINVLGAWRDVGFGRAGHVWAADYAMPR